MEDLLSILVFIVVVIFSIVSRIIRHSQTKIAKQSTQLPQNPQKSASNKVATLSNEIKRALETILESTNVESTTSMERKEEPSTKSEAVISSEEAINDLQRSLLKEKKIIEQQQTEHFYKHYGIQTTADLHFSHDELRRGIILAELLAPPVALRE